MLSKLPNRSRAAGLYFVNASDGKFTLKNGSQQSCGVYNPFFLNQKNSKKVFQITNIKQAMTEDYK